MGYALIEGQAVRKFFDNISFDFQNKKHSLQI